MIGFLAHWRESLGESCMSHGIGTVRLTEGAGQPVKIWRPRQLFIGSTSFERFLQEQVAREENDSTQGHTSKLSSKL